ncbi:hypothetical protein IscW_ISCW011785 [Ixodes scapularis]|uniref:Uncharacterized protein n=1 Tax=Ixodes scapularis TaxID=6945 RepID=B7Q922_IXOSC|nr:hypothetical protein IscW_ISCW011785 [Ixodes scapularis]|eukprot:XP_002412450.1 hypothetical protein IscW_ISCW011785 [Ixodes scapularis]
MTSLGLAIDQALYLGLDYALPFLPLKRPQREELETLQREGLQVCFDAHRYAISAQTLLKAGRNTVLNNGERHTLNDPTQLFGRPDTATLVERIRRCPKTRMEVDVSLDLPNMTSKRAQDTAVTRQLVLSTWPATGQMADWLQVYTDGYGDPARGTASDAALLCVSPGVCYGATRRSIKDTLS